MNVFLYTSLQNRFLFIIIVELNQNPWPPPFSNYDSSFIITIFFKLEFFRATSEVFSWSSMLKALSLGGWRLVLIDFLYNVSAWEKGVSLLLLLQALVHHLTSNYDLFASLRFRFRWGGNRGIVYCACCLWSYICFKVLINF